MKRSISIFSIFVFACGVLGTDALGQGDKDKSKPSKLTRIKDRDEFYKRADVVLNFEQFPSGEAMTERVPVNEKFLKKGVSFKAMNDISDVVSARRYNCGGPSGNYCIAPFNPPYHGKMKITFVPDKPMEPESKAVTEVGMYLAHVKRNGTIVKAFGKKNAYIGEIAVGEVQNKSGSHFLAFKSSVPIHYLMVVPVEAIDADFALDDLAFVKNTKKKKKKKAD